MKQNSGEMSREDAKLCLQWRCELRERRRYLTLRHAGSSCDEAIQSLSAEGFRVASLRSQ